MKAPTAARIPVATRLLPAACHWSTYQRHRSIEQSLSQAPTCQVSPLLPHTKCSRPVKRDAIQKTAMQTIMNCSSLNVEQGRTGKLDASGGQLLSTTITLTSSPVAHPSQTLEAADGLEPAAHFSSKRLEADVAGCHWLLGGSTLSQ